MLRESPRTLQDAYEAIAGALREFGYPSATAEMVRGTHESMKGGHAEMPHGIIGVFAQSQLDDAREIIAALA